MPRIECDRTETRLLEVWQLLESSLSEKAADEHKRLRRDELNAKAIESAYARLLELDLSQQQRHDVRRLLVRLIAELDLADVGDEYTAEVVRGKEAVLLNRTLTEKLGALRAIGADRGVLVPLEAQFWREGRENLAVIAWGEDALTCEPVPPRPANLG